jgi:hypothetical protein
MFYILKKLNIGNKIIVIVFLFFITLTTFAILSFKFLSKEPEKQNNFQSTPTTTKEIVQTTSIEKEQDLMVYERKDWGFKIYYPKNFNFIERELSDYSLSPYFFIDLNKEKISNYIDRAVRGGWIDDINFTFILSKDLYQNTNLSEAWVSIYILFINNPDENDIEDCKKFKFNIGEEKKIVYGEKEIINNIVWYKAEDRKVLRPGTSLNSKIYHTFYDNKCYEVSLNSVFTTLENYDPSLNVKEVKEEEIMAELMKILKNFTFLPVRETQEYFEKIRENADKKISYSTSGAINFTWNLNDKKELLINIENKEKNNDLLLIFQRYLRDRGKDYEYYFVPLIIVGKENKIDDVIYLETNPYKNEWEFSFFDLDKNGFLDFAIKWYYVAAYNTSDLFFLYNPSKKTFLTYDDLDDYDIDNSLAYGTQRGGLTSQSSWVYKAVNGELIKIREEEQPIHGYGGYVKELIGNKFVTTSEEVYNFENGKCQRIWRKLIGDELKPLYIFSFYFDENDNLLWEEVEFDENGKIIKKESGNYLDRYDKEPDCKKMIEESILYLKKEKFKSKYDCEMFEEGIEGTGC